MFMHILIIIMSCRWHGYPWSSLATSPYRSSPLAGLQGYIPYPHIAAVSMFELVVLLLPDHMWGSIGVHQLWPACLVRHIQDTHWGKSVYSTAPSDWAIHRVNVKTILFQIIHFNISTQFKCQNSFISSDSA